MAIIGTTGIVGNQARKAYFFKVVLQLLIGSAYFFGLVNVVYEKPLMNIWFNIGFGIVFTIVFLVRKYNMELSMIIGGILFQIFIFGHSYYLLPGKQIEIGFGLLTAILPIFVVGYRLWFFFIVNFILYHIALFSAGYEHVFFAQYGFFIVIFIMVNAILQENQRYERELIIQKDKIKRDAEALREADELKTRFFANISHELRTPLTLILSPMETILKSNELSNRNFTYLQLMQQNGEKLLKRINELLELSRLGANKLEIKEESVNIYQLTKQITASYEGAANLKQIDLDYINEIGSHVNLKLDVPKTEMIISNYLSNALKFTPQNGNITIRISKEENYLQISVKDTGIGIPKEALNEVFNRFYQVKREDYKEGTGIGLALCKELAELHHGKVWVESEVSKGSKFFVQLPYIETFAKIDPKKIIENEVLELDVASIKTIDKTTRLNKQSLLIVEDNVDLRQYMELLLSEKYEVVTAKNGQEAIEILGMNSDDKTHPSSGLIPNLIISDIMMPVMDGMTLLSHLKKSEKFRHLPVIMLTAQKHIEVKIDALRIGVDDYLTKPFKAEELLARIHNLIENTQQRINLTTSNKTIENKQNITSFDLKWLQEIEGKILQNISNSNFKLSDLAKEMNITSRTLQVRIKAITGQTPKKYQRSIQLHHARKLLKGGTIKTISELTYQLGFEDPHYFSTLYKKEFGISPKAELKNI